MAILHEIPQPLPEALSTNRSRDSIGQRRQEFDDMASTLAELVHELRQPLSTIEALTSYLEMVCTDMQTCAHLERIQDMLLQANGILERASDEHNC